jgi:YYY domain-containing protein
VFVWWLAVQIFSISTLPIVFYLFRAFPDRGYALAKSAGILLVSYVSWLIASAGLLPFGPISIIAAFVPLIVLNVVVLMSSRKKIITFFQRRWRYILIVEVAFLFMLLFFANIRTYSPEAMFDPGRSGAEKFGNMTHLSSIYTTRHFPPEDSWLSGNPINYYYFGHLQWATIGKFVGVGPQYAFNLGLATIVALTFLNAFGLTFFFTRRIFWALLVGWGVAVFGNFDGLYQFLMNFSREWAVFSAKDTGWLGPFFPTLNQALFHPWFDFWRSSRIVEHTITEFPWFTSILGDLHPHHSSISNWLLTTAVLLAILKTSGKTKIKSQLITLAPLYIFLLILFGISKIVNTWDQVTLLGLILTILTTRAVINVQADARSALWCFGAQIAVAFIFIYAVGQLFVKPFDSTFIPPMEFKPRELFQPLTPSLRTWFSDYLTHFGVFLVPIFIELAFIIRQHWKSKANDTFKVILFAMAGFIFVGKTVWGVMLPGFSIALFILGIYLIAQRKEEILDINAKAVIALVVFCQSVVLFVELFYVNDAYTGTLERYNTLFKFWYPLWLVYGVVAGWAAWRLWNRIPPRAWARKSVFALVAVFLIFTGMTYTFGATAHRTGVFNKNRILEIENLRKRTDDNAKKRIQEIETSMNRTLDARVYLATWPGYEDDYKIIEWLLENENGDAVILAGNKYYSSYGPWGHLATMTGNPTLIGWHHHEDQWRPVSFNEKFDNRMKAIKTIYTTLNWQDALKLLHEYNVKYVMVGHVERVELRKDAKNGYALDDVHFTKFEKNCDVAIRSGKSVLYRVPPAPPKAK